MNGRGGASIDALSTYPDDDTRKSSYAEKWEVAARLLTLRGVPTIDPGDEQGFVGDGDGQTARKNMFASRVATYNDDKPVGTEATTATANFDQRCAARAFAPGSITIMFPPLGYAACAAKDVQ